MAAWPEGRTKNKVMADSNFEGEMSYTNNKKRIVMQPPCPKLVNRIRANSFFLLGLHRKYQLSLTESAAFLRVGVLKEWESLGAAKRQRMIWWAARRAEPVDPVERLVLLSGRTHLVTTYTCKADDFLTSLLVLEALRMLSKKHQPGLDVIEAFQRQWEKFSACHARLTPRVFSRFLRQLCQRPPAKPEACRRWSGSKPLGSSGECSTVSVANDCRRFAMITVSRFRSIVSFGLFIHKTLPTFPSQWRRPKTSAPFPTLPELSNSGSLPGIAHLRQA